MWDLIYKLLNKEFIDFYDRQDKIEEVLRSLLSELSPREEQVIKYYYGVDDNNNWSTWDIASHFHVTEKEISDTIDEAMKKLQHPNRVKRLADIVLIPCIYKVTLDNPNGGEDIYFEGKVTYDEAQNKFGEAIVNQTKHRDEEGWVFRRVHLYRDDELLYSES